MKRWILFIMCMFILGCQFRPDTSDAVIIIDDIVVTAEEFNRAFESSFFSAMQEEEGIEQFVDVFIARKLLLKEAERLNLDKNPEFLSSIQLFWEQSLLRQIITKKTEEIAADVIITQQDIEEFHKENQQAFEDRALDEVKDQIRLFLLRQKQQELFQQWLSQLRRDANVLIKHEKIKINIDQPQEANP